MAQQPKVAVPLAEVDPTQILFSPKQTKTWDFMNKKTSKQMTGEQDFVQIFYKTPGERLAFVVENVKSGSGIQTTDNLKRGFMSVNLTPEQSAAIRQKIDEPLFTLVYQHREQLFRRGREITHPAEMKFLFKGIVKTGAAVIDKQTKQQKRDANGKVQVWSDSITSDIAFKTRNQQVMVDDNLCQIVDLNNQPYSWSCLDQKMLCELVIELDRVVFNANDIKVYCNFRVITVKGVGSGSLYTTKRRLEAAAAPPAEASNDQAAAGVDPPSKRRALEAADGAAPTHSTAVA